MTSRRPRLEKAAPDPSVTPVPLVSHADVRERLRLDDAFGDEEIRKLLDEAVAYVEGLTGLALLKANWTATYERFPVDGAALILPGLKAGITSLVYGASQTLLAHATVAGTPRGDLEIHAAAGPWPRDAGRWSVVVSGSRGVEADGLPGDLRSAVLLEIQRLYDRHDGVGQAISDLCGRYRPVTL